MMFKQKEYGADNNFKTELNRRTTPGFDEYLDLDLDSQVQRDLDLRLEQVFQMIKSQVPYCV